MLQQNLSGQTLGQYEILERIGQGGMGAVYLGYHPMLDRRVAVKAMLASLSDDADYVKRFVREARTSAALEHPYIVPIHDFGVQGDIAYVVMRLLTGGTLSERLESARKSDMALPTVQETLDILRHLSSALDYAHAQGVIHRDLKASNIMFDDKGTPFVVDFGLAKLVNTQSILTNTGVAMGTPTYMPPEQWRSEPVTPAADQYALAVLTYVMLAGVPPFDADNPFTMMQMHTEQPVPNISDERPDLPPTLNDVIRKGMAKSPDNRYASTETFADAFESAITSAPRSEPTGFFKISINSAAASSLANLTPTHDTEGPTLTPTPIMMGKQPSATAEASPPSATLTGASARASRRGIGVLVLLVVVMGAMVLAFALSQNNTNNDSTVDGTVIPNAIAGEATSAEGGVVVAEATEEAVENVASATIEPTSTETPTDAPTDTPTHTPTATTTPTASNTPDRAATRRADTRATADVIQTDNAMNAMLAQSAQGTLDAIDVQNTATQDAIEQANVDATATADLWTATPSLTFTPSDTPTSTATPTPTATPTASDTPTTTPLPTETPTATATSTSTATQTPLASATPTATTDVTAVALAIEAESTATQSAIFAELLNTCQPALATMSDSFDDACGGNVRNQICAGDETHLSDPARFVANMTTLNPDGEPVYVHLQAVTVDESTPPGMEILVFGGYKLTAQSATSQWLANVVSNTSARMRNTADGSRVIAGLQANTEVRLIGRNEAGDWLRLIYIEDGEEKIGWVASFLIDSPQDIMQLPIVADVNAPYFHANVWQLERGEDACSEMPFAGIFLRARTNLSYPVTINGVEVRASRGTYLYLDEDNALVVHAVNNTASLQQGESFLTLPEGTRITLPADSDTALLDAPLQAYDETILNNLPTSALRVTTRISDGISPEELIAAQALQTACRLIGASDAITLSGPGNDYALRDSLVTGELYDAAFIALVDGNFWYQLANDSWVRADDVATQGDCDVLPATLNLPPTPTITPTPVPVLRHRGLSNYRCDPSEHDFIEGDSFSFYINGVYGVSQEEAQASFDSAGGNGQILLNGVALPAVTTINSDVSGWATGTQANFVWTATAGTHTVTFIWGSRVDTCTFNVLPR